MSQPQRLAMVDREHPKLSVVKQCSLLGISRSSVYYQSAPASEEDLALMALMDRQYLKTPFYGSLIQGAPQLFDNGSGQQEKDQEALTAQLYQQIGQLKVERDFLSRKSGL